jgi:hypothetical protein
MLLELFDPRSTENCYNPVTRFEIVDRNWKGVYPKIAVKITRTTYDGTSSSDHLWLFDKVTMIDHINQARLVGLQVGEIWSTNVR